MNRQLAVEEQHKMHTCTCTYLNLNDNLSHVGKSKHIDKEKKGLEHSVGEQLCISDDIYMY